jgi:hypothetical protein
VLSQYENSEEMCDTVHVTGLSEVMLHSIHANATKIRARYASATLGVSWSSQARLTIMHSMESMLLTWIENQVKRNSSANLMAIKTKA